LFPYYKDTYINDWALPFGSILSESAGDLNQVMLNPPPRATSIVDGGPKQFDLEPDYSWLKKIAKDAPS